MTEAALALEIDPPPESLAGPDDLVRLLDEVHRFVAAFVRPAADAEDATAETFRAAVQRLRFPIPRHEARAWLLRVAHRRIADHRRRRRHDRLDESLAVEGDPTLGPAVRAVLAELPEAQAVALVLKYALGLSAEETAAALGKSLAATNSLLQRGRAAFVQKGASSVKTDDRRPIRDPPRRSLRPRAFCRPARRVAELRPRARVPWLALSGASAALAVAAFALTPRTVSAAVLIGQADRAVHQALTYRLESEALTSGAWGPRLAGLHAPGWRLESFPDGGFRLETPRALYRRDATGPILMTRRYRRDPVQERLEDDPSPEAYVRYLELSRSGSTPVKATLSLGGVHEEAGRRLREVTISTSGRNATPCRARFFIDEESHLPARIEIDRRDGAAWRLVGRARFTYPGPAAGSEPFVRPLRAGRIVDVDAKGSKIAIG